MAVWQFRVQRYAKGDGDTRISSVQHLNADDFDTAFLRLSDLVVGMRHAQPDCEFRVIYLSSHDYRGTDCDGGIRMFETADEMSERIAKAK